MTDLTTLADRIEAGTATAMIMRLSHFMGEQEEREAVVEWLRSTGDSKKHGSDWRTYYEIADAIEHEQHRRAHASEATNV